jgi:hypothetical protein
MPAVVMPGEFDSLSPPPLLLPGEDPERYRTLRQAIFDDLAPQSAIEWLLAIDVAELSWEMQRYRMLRHKLLGIYRQKAIEASLRRIDVEGIAPEFRAAAEFYTVRNALDWQFDPTAAHDIEARLASYGFDQHVINMEVYVQAREVFSLFESLLNGAQLRHVMLVKELFGLRQTRTSRRKNEAMTEGSNTSYAAAKGALNG